MTEPLREPSEELKRIVEEATYLRGRIVTHYSHAEFLLADFVVKCQNFEQYNGKEFKFPYSIEKRLKAVKEIASAEGPINKYLGKINAIIDDILLFERKRHFMAHGWMMLKYNRTGHLIEFRMYTQKKGGQFQLEYEDFDIQGMRKFSEKAATFLSNMQSLFREIYLQEGLESK